MIDLKGRVALITGSSDGIGASTAILFSSLGAKVILVGRNQSKLDSVAEKCQSKSPDGLKPVAIQADFEKDDDIKRTYSEAIKAHQRLDILVNNAGIVSSKGLNDADLLNDYDRVMQINVRSVVLLTQLVKDELFKAKGVIINVSSVASTKPNMTFWPYCMSKAALDMFTKSMAALLAPEIRVNSVNPGPVRTKILDFLGHGDGIWDTMALDCPLKKVSTPEEIAQLIAFMASDVAENMTGSIVVSDSGFLVHDQHKDVSTAIASPLKKKKKIP